MDTNFMFCWPHARQAIASHAHRTQAASHAQFKQDSLPSASEKELVKDELMYPSSALYHDGIILPSETRQVSLIRLVGKQVHWRSTTLLRDGVYYENYVALGRSQPWSSEVPSSNSPGRGESSFIQVLVF